MSPSESAGFEIVELVVPDTLDDPGSGSADFRAMVEVRNTVFEHAIGSDSMNALAAELFVHWRPTEFEVLHGLVAKVDGEIVGRAYAIMNTDPTAQDVECTVEVIPGFRRRGIGAALFDRLVEVVRADRRSILQGDFYAAADDQPSIPSPTGFGSMPADDPGVRFALARGFTLEQVERYSALPLPVPGAQLDASLAQLPTQPVYRVVNWLGPTPEEWLDDIALLHSRMRTDAPQGGLDLSEQVWNAERVRQLDGGRVEAGLTALTCAVLHEPSHQLVALTELMVPADIARPVNQNDTLVLREHRGHRLGMLLKLENLKFLQRVAPGHPFIQTFNAEENRPMLDVNEAMGFVPRAYGGTWKLVLS